MAVSDRSRTSYVLGACLEYSSHLLSGNSLTVLLSERRPWPAPLDPRRSSQNKARVPDSISSYSGPLLRSFSVLGFLDTDRRNGVFIWSNSYSSHVPFLSCLHNDLCMPFIQVLYVQLKAQSWLACYTDCGRTPVLGRCADSDPCLITAR